jgi:parallel beta-helix repeat protein
MSVLIPAGKKILLDENTPDLAALMIDGELMFEDGKRLELQADYIQLKGSLYIGSSAAPYSGNATITLNATDPNQSIEAMGTRGILVMGGKLNLFGKAPQTIYTKLSDHVQAGARTLPVLQSSGWQIGDQIVVAPTDYYGTSETERVQLASASATQVNATAALSKARWGKLQYLTANGMSLTQDPNYKPRVTGTPTVLDERAVVGNLTRNIVIQSVNDNLWTNQGFGAHVMVMGNTSVANINGVEMRRMGQSGATGRYPVHFHQMSYDTSGKELPLGGVRKITTSSIWDSKNRCIVLHGSNDITVDRNICYNIAGHAIFLEDAVERRNTITNNLVLKVRIPAKPLIESDTDLFQRGPSGFWITNPDNTVKGNTAGDIEGTGFWMAFPVGPLGINKAVAVRPTNTKLGLFEDNVSHSNSKVGLQLDWAPVNDAGATDPQRYIPTVDGQPERYEYHRYLRMKFARITTYKNRDSGFWNRVSLPDYEEWVSADNVGVSFAGAGDDGRIYRSLLVGTSLNNANTWQQIDPNNPVVAFASYHSTFAMTDNAVVNFPFVNGKSSGAFRTTDYYTSAVNRGLVRNPNNDLIGSHPGYRYPVQTQENWTLAGALWDPHGYWGAKGNYWTYDDPFLTVDGNCAAVAPVGSNGVSCGTEYYGVENYWMDSSVRFRPLMPVRATRYNAQGGVVGTWNVGAGNDAAAFNVMRHFAAMRGGRYLLEFPGLIPSNFLQLEVSNAYRANDEFILGVSFSGSSQPGRVAVISMKDRTTRTLSPASSYESAIASNGAQYWQDQAKQVIWMKVITPNGDSYANQTDYSDRNLYRPFELRIEK